MMEASCGFSWAFYMPPSSKFRVNVDDCRKEKQMGSSFFTRN